MAVNSYRIYHKNNYSEYEFISDGPKGEITKIVTYTKFSEQPPIYNLAFGDLNPVTGSIDDLAISDNSDTQKILITVASTVIEFSNYYGNPYIFLTGSTPSRTRLYQMSIAKHLDELNSDFSILGIKGGRTMPFEKNVNYSAFLVKRK